MPDALPRVYLKALRALPNTCLELEFHSGEVCVIDMSDDVGKYPGLAPLAVPDACEGARLGEGGWAAEWPALDIQIGADTLFQSMLDSHGHEPGQPGNKKAPSRG